MYDFLPRSVIRQRGDAGALCSRGPTPLCMFVRGSFFLLFFLASIGLALCNVYPGDVHQDTAEIFMWSTLGFKLIYAKHAPLLPWIVGAVNQLVPVNFFV